MCIISECHKVERGGETPDYLQERQIERRILIEWLGGVVVGDKMYKGQKKDARKRADKQRGGGL